VLHQPPAEFLPILCLELGTSSHIFIMNGSKKTSTPPPLSSLPIHAVDAVLELQDGAVYAGVSFGASAKSVAGECVFQTGD